MAAGVGHLSVTFAIAEGARTAVGAIELMGNATVAEGDLRAAMKVRPGDGYYDRAIVGGPRGHAAGVPRSRVSAGGRLDRAEISRRIGVRRTSRYRINEGRWFSSITSSWSATGARAKRRSAPSCCEARRAARPLAALRKPAPVERARPVQADSDRHLAHGASRADLIVTVEEADPTTIGYGGGLQADTLTVLGPDGLAEERIEVAPRGFFEIGRRNLGGKNRSLNFSTRVSFRRKGETFDPTEGGGYGFNEYRVLGTYREPRLFRTRFDGSVVAFAEQAIRTTFNFRRIGLNADIVRAITPTTRVNGRYSIGRTRAIRRANPARGRSDHRPALPPGSAVELWRRVVSRHA